MESPNEELKDEWFLQVEDMKRFWSLRDQFEEINFVAGVDISFVKGDTTNACAGIVVLSYPTLKPVYEKFVPIKLTVPYIPGFLAFREVGFLMELLDTLKKEKPEYYPQLVFVDGNGKQLPLKAAYKLRLWRNAESILRYSSPTIFWACLSFGGFV